MELNPSNKLYGLATDSYIGKFNSSKSMTRGSELE